MIIGNSIFHRHYICYYQGIAEHQLRIGDGQAKRMDSHLGLNPKKISPERFKKISFSHILAGSSIRINNPETTDSIISSHRNMNPKREREVHFIVKFFPRGKNSFESKSNLGRILLEMELKKKTLSLSLNLYC